MFRTPVKGVSTSETQDRGAEILHTSKGVVIGAQILAVAPTRVKRMRRRKTLKSVSAEHVQFGAV